MSNSQIRYMNYFDQVILNDFIPLTRPLIMCKIIITLEREMSPQKSKSDDIESQLEQFDYSKMINNLFVRVFADDEALLFD